MSEKLPIVLVEPVVIIPEPAKRGRRKKEPLPSSFPSLDPKVLESSKFVEPLEIKVVEPLEMVSTEPLVPVRKIRGKAKKQLEVAEPIQVVTEKPNEPVAVQPNEPVQAQFIEPSPEVLKVKTRGRPKKNPEPVPVVVQTPVVKARGRKPSRVEAIVPEAALSDPEALENPPALNPETLEVIPEAPATKKLVRLRREAKEHVFSYQGALYNPYQALLEHFRANPNGLNSRELSLELDQTLLERLGGRKGLEDAVIGLERTGYLIAPKRGIYQPSREFVPIVGRLEVRSDGSGWFTPDTPGLRSMLIPNDSLLFAWHNDRVVARELRRNGQSEGEVIRVLERARETLTGTLEYKRGYALLRPD
ncbi:MAG: hypothetical protein RLZZ156_1648, partial [Deinococcota bacterium]